MGVPRVSKAVWCDVAFARTEVAARLADARRVRGEGERNVVCVVIDVLRATTSIAAILENGCAAIYPCASPGAARALARGLRHRHGPGEILLGGEQDGKPIEGFDAGNSPLEYTSERIGGKMLAFSTSNGTGTLAAVQGCGEVFTAAFVNITAAAKRAGRLLRANPGRTLLIACAGREGAYCEEDAVAAGVLLRILSGKAAPLALSDAARAALRLAEGAERDLEKMLLRSWWGKHLCALGLGDDVSFCGRKDVTSVVPVLAGGAITRAQPPGAPPNAPSTALSASGESAPGFR